MAIRNRREEGEADEDHLSDDDDVVGELRRQAKAMSPLEPGRLAALLNRAALGDRASEERIVAANLTLVIRQAELHEGHGLSLPDLIQEGSLGLLEAVRSFSGGADGFAAFAKAKVEAQIQSAIATEAAAVRDAELLLAAATDYERTELLLCRELGRVPVEREIAEKLEWTVDRTRYVALVVAEARRKHDEELLAFIDPAAIDFDPVDTDESAELDG